jgi:hypothetical protein
MVPLWFRSVIAGALILSLALPGWTAEETKVPTKEEKLEKKAPVKGSVRILKSSKRL